MRRRVFRNTFRGQKPRQAPTPLDTRMFRSHKPEPSATSAPRAWPLCLLAKGTLLVRTLVEAALLSPSARAVSLALSA